MAYQDPKIVSTADGSVKDKTGYGAGVATEDEAPDSLAPVDVKTFAGMVRSRYGAYHDWSDHDLTKSFLDKYPAYHPIVIRDSRLTAMLDEPDDPSYQTGEHFTKNPDTLDTSATRPRRVEGQTSPPGPTEPGTAPSMLSERNRQAIARPRLARPGAPDAQGEATGTIEDQARYYGANYLGYQKQISEAGIKKEQEEAPPRSIRDVAQARQKTKKIPPPAAGDAGRKIDGHDLEWHVGMSVQEFNGLPKAKQAEVYSFVQKQVLNDDEKKKQKIPLSPSSSYQIGNRKQLKLPEGPTATPRPQSFSVTATGTTMNDEEIDQSWAKSRRAKALNEELARQGPGLPPLSQRLKARGIALPDVSVPGAPPDVKYTEEDKYAALQHLGMSDAQIKALGVKTTSAKGSNYIPPTSAPTHSLGEKISTIPEMFDHIFPETLGETVTTEKHAAIQGLTGFGSLWAGLSSIAASVDPTGYAKHFHDAMVNGMAARMSDVQKEKATAALDQLTRTGNADPALLSQLNEVLTVGGLGYVKYAGLGALFGAAGIEMSTPAIFGVVSAVDNADKPVIKQVTELGKNVASGYAIHVLGQFGRVPGAVGMGAISGVEAAASGQPILPAIATGAILGGALANPEGIEAKEIPHQVVRVALGNENVPDSVKDLLSRLGDFEKAVVFSEDGRAMSLYQDQKSGEFFGQVITAEEAKRYDPSIVTGGKRPVRQSSNVSADDFDRLRAILNIDDAREVPSAPPGLPGATVPPTEKERDVTPKASEPATPPPAETPEQTAQPAAASPPVAEFNHANWQALYDKIISGEASAHDVAEFRRQSEGVGVSPESVDEMIAAAREVAAAASPEKSPPIPAKGQTDVSDQPTKEEGKQVGGESRDETGVTSKREGGVPDQAAEKETRSLREAEASRAEVPTRQSDEPGTERRQGDPRTADSDPTFLRKIAADNGGDVTKTPEGYRVTFDDQSLTFGTAKEAIALVRASVNQRVKFAEKKASDPNADVEAGLTRDVVNAAKGANLLRNKVDAAATNAKPLPTDPGLDTWPVNSPQNQAAIAKLEEGGNQPARERVLRKEIAKVLEDGDYQARDGRIWRVRGYRGLWQIFGVDGNSGNGEELDLAGAIKIKDADSDGNPIPLAGEAKISAPKAATVKTQVGSLPSPATAGAPTRRGIQVKAPPVAEKPAETTAKQATEIAAVKPRDESGQFAEHIQAFSEKVREAAKTRKHEDLQPVLDEMKGYKEAHSTDTLDGLITATEKAIVHAQKVVKAQAGASEPPPQLGLAPSGWETADTSVDETPTFTTEDNRVSFTGGKPAQLLNDALTSEGINIAERGGVKGVFMQTNAHVEKVISALRRSDNPVSHELANQIVVASNGATRPVIVGAVATIPHEMFHETSSQSMRTLNDRHAHYYSLIAGPEWMTMRDGLMSKGYPDTGPVLVEEAAAHIAAGQYAELGLTRKEAVDWMTKWFDSFIEKNPNVTPEQFQEMSDEASKARDTAYAESAQREQESDETVQSLQDRREAGVGGGATRAGPLFARSADDPWADLDALTERLSNPQGEKERALPKTFAAAEMEEGANKTYRPKSILDDGVTLGKQMVAEKGIDGAMEFVRSGDGIEWASTGYEVLSNLRDQESAMRPTNPEAADQIAKRRLDFLNEFVEGATTRGQSIAGVRAIEEFAPDRSVYLLNRASMKRRGRGLSQEEEATMARLGQELERERDRSKGLESALAEAEKRATRKTREGKQAKKSDYQTRLSEQSDIILRTLKPKVGSLDFGNLKPEQFTAQKGSVGEGGPLPGDAELLAQYAAGRLSDIDTVADLNEHLLSEFGPDIAGFLPTIRRRAYQIRQSARLAEMESNETTNTRRRTILSEIQKEVGDARQAVKDWERHVASGKTSEERAAARKSSAIERAWERIEQSNLKAEEKATKLSEIQRQRVEAKEAETRARLEARAAEKTRAAEAKRQEAEESSRLEREDRQRLGQIRREYAEAEAAKVSGYRESIRAQRKAARLAALWDTPIRNEASAARTRLTAATEAKDPDVLNDLVSVAAEKLLPDKTGGSPRTGVIAPSRFYVELKDEFPKLVTDKNKGEIYKRARQRIKDMTAAAREVAAMRNAGIEARKYWDDQGVDVDAQAILIRKAENARRQQDLRARMVAEFNRVSRSRTRRVIDETENIPRAMQTTLNMHQGRQGLFFILTHPIRVTGRMGIPGTLKGYASFTRAQYRQRVAELQQHPDYALAVKAGVNLSELPGTVEDARLAVEEDELQSTVAMNLPHVRLSNQGFALGMNSERVEGFSIYASIGRAEGYTWENNPQFFKEIAEFVNTVTGRTSMGKKLTALSAFTNHIFYATRLNVSRIKMVNDLFNPFAYRNIDPVTRGIRIREAIKVAAVLAALFLAAKVLGFKTELDDANSPDQFKVVWGNTHYDLTGGIGTTFRYAYRMIRTSALEATGRKVPGNEELFELSKRFFRQKLAPWPTAVVDYFSGKNAVGEPANLQIDVHHPVTTVERNIVLRMLMPIVIDDFAKGYSDDGWLGVAKTLPVLAGFGAQNYEPKARDIIKEIRESHPAVAKEMERLKGKGFTGEINPPKQAEKESDESYKTRTIAETKAAISAVEKLIASEAHYRSLKTREDKQAAIKAAIKIGREEVRKKLGFESPEKDEHVDDGNEETDDSNERTVPHDRGEKRRDARKSKRRNRFLKHQTSSIGYDIRRPRVET